MQHHLVRILPCVALESLAPVVANSVRKNRARLVERRRRDAAADIGIPFQTVLGVLVPKVKGAVAACRAECAVLGVERDIVDRVDVCHAALRRVAMALEGKVEAGGEISKTEADDRAEEIRIFLPSVLVLHILNGATAFNTANGEALRVGEATHNPSLPLQGALQRLVKLGGLFEVDDVDIPICRADDEEVVSNVHGVHALLALQRSHRLGTPEVPVLDSLVPGPSDRHWGAVRLEVSHASNGRVVLCNLHRLAGVQVEHLGHLVGTCRQDFGSILRYVSTSCEARRGEMPQLRTYLEEVD